jgi:hypothetical protein
MLLSHLALPRDGHLHQVFHIFAYLRKYHNSEIVYDPSDPCVDDIGFELQDWTSSQFGHLQADEELPPNMPQPRGLGFTMSAKVDARDMPMSMATISLCLLTLRFLTLR